jgi:ferredoxin-NADP reductase
VPDIAGRDVFLCGPPAMTGATVRALRRAGVPARQIHTEAFAY